MISRIKGSAGAWIAPFGCAIVLLACGDAVGIPIRSKSVNATDVAVESDAQGPDLSRIADASDAVDAEPPKDAAESVDAAQPDAAQPDAAQPDAAQPDAAQPDAAQPDAAQPNSAGVTQTADCATVAQWPEEWENAEDALLEAIINDPFICEGSWLVNWRYDNLPHLRLFPDLRCSARLHSLDMAQRGFFSRTNPDGITPPDRMRAAGFDNVWLWVEWIHQGSDPDEAWEFLMERDTWGCEYLTNFRLSAIGIGYYDGYWTLDLASPE